MLTTRGPRPKLGWPPPEKGENTRRCPPPPVPVLPAPRPVTGAFLPRPSGQEWPGYRFTAPGGTAHLARYAHSPPPVTPSTWLGMPSHLPRIYQIRPRNREIRARKCEIRPRNREIRPRKRQIRPRNTRKPPQNPSKPARNAEITALSGFCSPALSRPIPSSQSPPVSKSPLLPVSKSHRLPAWPPAPSQTLVIHAATDPKLDPWCMPIDGSGWPP